MNFNCFCSFVSKNALPTGHLSWQTWRHVLWRHWKSLWIRSCPDGRDWTTFVEVVNVIKSVQPISKLSPCPSGRCLPWPRQILVINCGKRWVWQDNSWVIWSFKISINRPENWTQSWKSTDWPTECHAILQFVSIPAEIERWHVKLSFLVNDKKTTTCPKLEKKVFFVQLDEDNPQI